MYRLLVLIAILLCSALSWATSCPSTYTNSYTLTIATQSALSSNLTNFPVLFTGNAILATTGSGGVSQSSGLDVVFCTAASGGTILPYELVAGTYTSITGAGEWWIQAPTISHTATETIYVMVGAASATDYSTPATVWSSYLGVWHFGTSTSLTLTDSTGNNTATNHGGTATTGPTAFSGAAAFAAASSQYIDLGGTLNATSSHISMLAWINPTGFEACQRIMSNLTGSAYNGYEFYLGSGCVANGTGVVQIGTSGTLSGTNTGSAVSPGSWSMLAGVVNGTGATWRSRM